MMSNDIIIKATIGVETRRCNLKLPMKCGPDELYPLIIAEVSRVFNASVSNIPRFYTDPEGSNCAFVATTLDDAFFPVVAILAHPYVCGIAAPRRNQKTTKKVIR